MNSFTYRYPVTVYFGEKAAEKNLPAELQKVGKNVMLACGGEMMLLFPRRRREQKVVSDSEPS